MESAPAQSISALIGQKASYRSGYRQLRLPLVSANVSKSGPPVADAHAVTSPCGFGDAAEHVLIARAPGADISAAEADFPVVAGGASQ
ncbi:hypothetical protein NDU88_007009 [Pleurodeles waltl]|uniref:Uncharacterized protein n=1 Tax=Pleurodeles waltl TaxID=8319 RepID=A0AAV7MEQ4_PLEWA|nr:hypothetical protein NDU88_007009 [Pleurodeles waltl]